MNVIVIGQPAILDYKLDKILVQAGYSFAGYYQTTDDALVHVDTESVALIMLDKYIDKDINLVVAQLHERMNIPILLLEYTDKIPTSDLPDNTVYLPIDAINLRSIIRSFLQITDLSKNLKYSEESFRILFKKAADPILLIDPESFQIVECNDKANVFIGLTEDELLKRTICDIGINESSDAIKNGVNNITSSGDLFQVKLTDIDGDIHDVSIQAIRIQIHGKSYIQGIFRDITELKNVQRALRKSKRRLDFALQGAKLGWWDLDIKSGRFLYDDETAKVIGYTLDDIHNDAMTLAKKVIHPDDFNNFKKIFKQHVTGLNDSFNMEFRVISRSGKIKWLFCRGNIVEWDETGRPSRSSGTQLDITDKKETEIANEILDNQYKLLAENVTDVIWILRIGSDTIEYISPSVYSNTGYTTEEILSMNLDRWMNTDSIHKGLQILLHELENDSKEGVELYRSVTLEMGVVKKDGTILMTEATMSFIRDSNNIPVSILGVSRDITERKNAELQIRQSLLEKEVLLREIHHRVKNNFQVIIGFLNLQMTRIFNQESLSLFRDFEDRIRAMALIHDQLYQSQNLSRIDISQYVRQIIAELALSYECEKRHINFIISSESVMLDVNRAIPCAIVLNEILTNSLKYAFPKNRDSGAIEVKLAADDDYIKLDISDNGIGIPSDIDITNQEYLGFRIINMTISNQLKGTVNIRRQKGTGFSITFPAN